ncbi:peroxiredoxin-like family protein [Sorangium sp. So ce295]|uniref:peroxiredoxin-like family protein n=1 Tax=Sorangium sp. So ce295 TaxID=3133295 RepID=UPI003F62B220
MSTVNVDATSPSPRARAVIIGAITTLVATAIHHVYGGVRYATPWRLHGAAVALALCVPIALAYAGYRRSPGTRAGRISGGSLAALALAFPVTSIGLFEGAYNHLAKNVLFFAGAPRDLLLRMFPPPTYELPSDAFFEITGVGQIVPAAIAAIAALGLIGDLRRRVTRLAPGAVLGARELVGVHGERIRIPDPTQIVHLQLRRFAGCPVCNLHLRSITVRHDEIAAAGIREVVVFHSSADELRLHAGGLPFAVVPDPEKRLYAELGAEPSLLSVFDPRVWPTIVRSVARSAIAILRGRERPPALIPTGGRFGLPADFLVAPDGRVLASKYGEHAGDQWSVDEVLALTRAPAVSSVRAAAEVCAP